MKNNIKYNGLSSYSLSEKKIKISKFSLLVICLILIFLLLVIKIFSNIQEVSNIENIEEKKVSEYTYAQSENEVISSIYLDDEKVSFLQTISKEATKTYKKYGILPSITIAQAILESGWGSSELAVTHNNLFGIKADSRWSGAVATVVTSENYNDSTTATFRKYESIMDSIEDHGKFLYENARYSDNGLFDGKDFIAQAQALEDAGYSTAKNENGEPIYADKLISVIEKYNLKEYDKN